MQLNDNKFDLYFKITRMITYQRSVDQGSIVVVYFSFFRISTSNLILSGVRLVCSKTLFSHFETIVLVGPGLKYFSFQNYTFDGKKSDGMSRLVFEKKLIPPPLDEEGMSGLRGWFQLLSLHPSWRQSGIVNQRRHKNMRHPSWSMPLLMQVILHACPGFILSCVLFAQVRDG